MKKWDTIYVKQGTKIVGRGVVTRPYRFGDAQLLVDNEGFPWRHQVKVSWDARFEPIDIKLGAEPMTVLPLSGDRLHRLLQALSADASFMQARVRSDIESLKHEGELFEEGGKKRRFTSHYERDPRLRESAIRHHGYLCSVCGFDFADVYGEQGLGFIEVHHLRPVSTLGKRTKVDPNRDMATVCSNCHRMMHRTRERVLTIDELKEMIGTRDE
ncbi:MAG: HNH endonuclease [Dehalococcoidia bacterium]|nr:HNH endonuclease [Dehalococcoidia bacterium]